MALPLFLVVVLIFSALIIITLISTLVYFIFFNKVPVIAINNGSASAEQIRAKKKGNKLFYKNSTIPIYKNYITIGNKKIYLALKIDDDSYVPYNLIGEGQVEFLDKIYDKINSKDEKLKELDEEQANTRYYGFIPKLDIDYNFKAAIANSYHEGATRFKFGFDKIAPFALLTIFVIMIVIGTIMSVKYNTEMTPASASAIQELGANLEACAAFVSEGQQVNRAILEELNQGQRVSVPD